MKKNFEKKAVLVLEDGTHFFGHTCGIESTVYGEVVFNTSLTGYQEICTDPSYANQLVLFTMPHIGNVGVNKGDSESERVWLKGIIVLKMSKTSSNWRSEQTLVSFLKEHQITWIEGIDTRKLTRHLRENGVKSGCIMVGEIDIDLARKLAIRHAEEKELNLSFVPSEKNHFHSKEHLSSKKIAVYDFGVKSNILRILSNLGCHLKIFPGTKTIEELMSWQPHGVVISNGPGDPARMYHGIQETKKLIDTGIPIFGICLGCQLLALALGGKTKAMKFGHHGTNHPVYDLTKNKVHITSQNHLFAIDENHLPPNCLVTHQSLFDGTIQGIRLKEFPVFGFQGHPEGSPGPQDASLLFNDFLQYV